MIVSSLLFCLKFAGIVIGASALIAVPIGFVAFLLWEAGRTLSSSMGGIRVMRWDDDRGRRRGELPPASNRRILGACLALLVLEVAIYFALKVGLGG